MLPSTKSSDRRSRRSDGSGGGLSGAISTFANLIMSLSNGWRAFVLIAIAAIAGVIVYEKYVVSTPAPLLPAPYATGGTPDPGHPGADNLNPQNIEAADKSDEDNSAVSWHFNHKPDDDPKEIAIDAQNTVFYRYFSQTDHCVYIRRHIGDSDRTQWIRDPNFHTHDVHQPRRSALDPSGNGPSVTDTAVGRWIAMFFPVVQASTSSATGGQILGTCLNPHPGQFRYWWGAPIDQCNSPMYRQFADGCTHYQIYNRCANSWDSRINWTKCVAQHHQ